MQLLREVFGMASLNFLLQVLSCSDGRVPGRVGVIGATIEDCDWRCTVRIYKYGYGIPLSLPDLGFDAVPRRAISAIGPALQ